MVVLLGTRAVFSKKVLSVKRNSGEKVPQTGAVIFVCPGCPFCELAASALCD
jgi:hypothetical protein